MDTKGKIEVMQAFSRGEKIESDQGSKGRAWFRFTGRQNAEPEWNWGRVNYRIKPKPRVPREWLLGGAGITASRFAIPYHEGTPLSGIRVREVLPEDCK